MSGRIVPASLLTAQSLGAGLAELGQRRDVEHALGVSGSSPASNRLRQRMVIDGGSTSVKNSV